MVRRRVESTSSDHEPTRSVRNGFCLVNSPLHRSSEVQGELPAAACAPPGTTAQTKRAIHRTPILACFLAGSPSRRLSADITIERNTKLHLDHRIDSTGCL